MAISHILGTAAANVSHFLGTAKANVSAILGATASFGGGGSGDADVDAFITATGISDATIEGAILALVTDLKADGIWANCIAIYPFVGGSAATHAVNLKNPGTFDITWAGTVTHNANGITPNGSTGWGDTGIDPSTDLTVDDTHLSFYCRTAAPSTSYQIGCWNSGASRRFQLGANAFGANWYYATAYAEPGNRLQGAYGSGDARGMQLQTRRSSTDFEVYRNGVTLASTATAQSNDLSTLTDTIYVGGMNQAGTGESSDANLALASVGAGLTDTEVADYNTAVQAFQTTLSRNV